VYFIHFTRLKASNVIRLSTIKETVTKRGNVSHDA